MILTNIKMLALDIDGTLMDSKKRFPEINCRALQACEKRGIRIALISGRSFELMRLFARELGVHPLMAACNGARIEAGAYGPTLSENCFSTQDALRIYDTLEKSGMYFNSYSRGKNYMGNPEVRKSLGERYAHHAPGITGEFGYWYETVCDRERMLSEGIEDIYKFVVMGEPYDENFRKIAREFEDMNLSISSASKRNMEFMPTGIDKGSAVRMLCDKMGISTDEVMAFGDQTNDIPMFRAAGWPVAMANGEESVKAAAKFIAPDHNLGGVGLFIEEMILGEK